MLFQRPKPKNDDERILPLINVVFLLLIFFMIVGKFTPPDPFDIEPTQSTSETNTEETEILILINIQGILALNGNILDDDSFKTTLAKHLNGADKNTPLIRLKADGRAPAERVIEVMEWLRKAGIQNLIFLTTRAPRS